MAGFFLRTASHPRFRSGGSPEIRLDPQEMALDPRHIFATTTPIFNEWVVYPGFFRMEHDGTSPFLWTWFTGTTCCHWCLKKMVPKMWLFMLDIWMHLMYLQVGHKDTLIKRCACLDASRLKQLKQRLRTDKECSSLLIICTYLGCIILVACILLYVFQSGPPPVIQQ